MLRWPAIRLRQTVCALSRNSRYRSIVSESIKHTSALIINCKMSEQRTQGFRLLPAHLCFWANLTGLSLWALWQELSWVSLFLGIITHNTEGLFTPGTSEKFHQRRCLHCDAEGCVTMSWCRDWPEVHSCISFYWRKQLCWWKLMRWVSSNISTHPVCSDPEGICSWTEDVSVTGVSSWQPTCPLFTWFPCSTGIAVREQWPPPPSSPIQSRK